jgi:hypothetical protein
MSKEWTKEEKKILKKYYKKKDKKELMELLPNRSWAAINQYSQKLNIKRSYDTVRTTNVKKLIEETPEAYYWMGFLMADGHFTEKRIIVGLSIKDVDHIKKFAKFISADYSEGNKKCCGKYYGSCSVSAANSDIVPLLREKFKIHSNKTHNPCDITWIKNNGLLLSLIIGFIDGDGSISRQTNRTDTFLRIKCHSSWLFNLQFISDIICKDCNLKPNIAAINRQGYAAVAFSNSIILKFLKKKGKDLKLPVLKRKWDRVNENFISKFEEYSYILKEVKNLIKEGLKNYDIADIVDRSPASIYQMVKKHNLRKI